MSKKPLVITVINNKGGVGKTTTAAAFTHLLSKKHRVLLIDTDPQGNCLQKIGLEADIGIGNLGRLLNQFAFNPAEKEPIKNFISPSPKLPTVDAVISGRDLNTTVFPAVFSDPSRIFIFQDVIAELGKEYDYVVIDTFPTFNAVTNAIIIGSDVLVVPVFPDKNSIESSIMVNEYLKKASRFNPDVIIGGVFLNNYFDASSSVKELRPLIENIWGDKFLKAMVPKNISTEKAINRDEPVTLRYPDSKASKALEKVLKEVLKNVEEK